MFCLFVCLWRYLEIVGSTLHPTDDRKLVESKRQGLDTKTFIVQSTQIFFGFLKVKEKTSKESSSENFLGVNTYFSVMFVVPFLCTSLHPISWKYLIFHVFRFGSFGLLHDYYSSLSSSLGSGNFVKDERIVDTISMISTSLLPIKWRKRFDWVNLVIRSTSVTLCGQV